MTQLTFGQAIEALKHGKKVARAGWNGKGMFLWLKPAAEIHQSWCKDPMLIDLCEQNGGWIDALGTICMFTHDSTGRKAILTGWLASQSDMLLEDWYVVGEEDNESPVGVPRVIVHRGYAVCCENGRVQIIGEAGIVREIEVDTSDMSAAKLKAYIDDYLSDPRYQNAEKETEKPAAAPTVPLKLAIEVAERIDDPEVDEFMKAGSIYEIATAPTLMSVKKNTLRRVIRWMWHKIWAWEVDEQPRQTK